MHDDAYADVHDSTEQKISLNRDSDAELLEKLRNGNNEAYEALWRRHVDAALTVAKKVAPSRAEDLVSESFLAVYHQVAVNGNGPESAFRAYLFTTMRNRAMQWSNADRRLVAADEFESLHEEDGLSALDAQATSSHLLEAFKALPERWQRVLWLAEVEQQPRPEIAADLGIKPNAVSALVRRARTGLRMQWLAHAVPVSLKNNQAHLATQVLAEITGEKLSVPKSQYQAHLSSCGTCRELRHDLREQYQRMHRSTLATAGFAALGIVLPAAAPSTLTALGAGGAFLVGGTGTAMLAASVSLLLVGGSVTAGVLWISEANSTSLERSSQVAETSASDESEHTHSNDNTPDQASPTDTSSANSTVGGNRLLGRGNTSHSVTTLEFGAQDRYTDSYIPVSTPTAVSPHNLVSLPTLESPEAVPFHLTTPISQIAFLAPMLTGTSSPSATIVIELDIPGSSTNGHSVTTKQYVVPSDVNGAWSLDTKPIAKEIAGRYSYRVWSVKDSNTSAVVQGWFEVLPLMITGFEQLAPFEEVPLEESSTTGIVFEAHGTPLGTVCLASVYSGQSVEVPLDAEGRAVKRLRMLVGGTYLFNFRSCQGEHRGPATEIFVDVFDADAQIFGPFGPDPATTEFELTEV